MAPGAASFLSRPPAARLLAAAARRRLGAEWTFRLAPGGWLDIQRPFAVGRGVDPLRLQAEWPGPLKVFTGGRGLVQRCEIPAAALLHSDLEMGPEEAATRLEAYIDEVATGILPGGDGQNTPDAVPRQLAGSRGIAAWLVEAGQEVAIDKEENLRFTLRLRGCDGQARMLRAMGGVRFILPLATWRDAPAEALAFMRELSSRANDALRLVRIAWLEDGACGRVEAQVDLGGLPAGSELAEAVWKDAVRFAVQGLAMALRYLGFELPAVARGVIPLEVLASAVHPGAEAARPPSR